MIFLGHQIHQGRDIEQGNKERYDKSSDETYRHGSEQFILESKNQESYDGR